VDVDFGFDPLLWRYWQRVGEALKVFRPDLVHIICPGDFGVLGACWAHKLRIPMVGSFHTNLHQFAAVRLQKNLRLVPEGPRRAIRSLVEKVCGKGLFKFYEIPRLLLAPNPEIKGLLEGATGRPCHLMRRGVDTDLFHPSLRNIQEDGVFRLGYVGRLMREKNLRLLAELERALIASGHVPYRFVIVGHGDELLWLKENLIRADFTGVLHGEELARAYANLDLFLFPSRTDAFDNVVLEALAAGTPALVTSEGGPKYLVSSGVTGYVADGDCDFIAKAISAISESRLHREMRAAAREAACLACWDRIFEEVWDSYDTCLQLPPRKARLTYGHPLKKREPGIVYETRADLQP
jgi:glycosyltransferase involved in cell wall biosynthesis